MPIPTQDYKMRPGETQSAYNARIAGLRQNEGLISIEDALRTAAPEVRTKAGLPTLNNTGRTTDTNLPSNAPTNDLLNFSKVMDDMTLKSKQNRAKAFLNVANGDSIPTGALDAGSFGQLLGVAAQSSNDFMGQVTKQAFDTFYPEPTEEKVPTGDLGVFQQLYGRPPNSPEEFLTFVQDLSQANSTKTTSSSGSGGTSTGKTLSISQVDDFRRSYGWTPPLNYTMDQLVKYVADNPNASPEELEAGAKSLTTKTNTTTAKSTVTVDELITSITSSLTSDQLKALKAKADAAGISSMFKSKSTDVTNYLNSIKDKINTALQAGYSKDEIIKFLTS